MAEKNGLGSFYGAFGHHCRGRASRGFGATADIGNSPIDTFGEVIAVDAEEDC